MTIPDGFAQVNFHFEGAGLFYPAECTIGLDVTASSDSPEEIAEILADAWEAEINPSLTNVVTLTEVTVKFGPDVTGPSGSWSGAHQGNVSTSGASPAVTYLVKKGTAFGGRAGRGRMYVPGVPEAQVGSDGDLDDTWVANMTTGFSDWAAVAVANNLGLVLLHQPGSPLATPTPITSLQVDGRVATQRRRNRR